MKTIKFTLALVVLLLCCTSLQAKPNKHHFYQSGYWWLAEGEMVTIEAVKYDLAYRNPTVHHVGAETGVLLGPNPSIGRTVGIDIANTAYDTFFHAVSFELMRKESRTWQTVGLGVTPAWVSAIGGYDISNYLGACRRAHIKC